MEQYTFDVEADKQADRVTSGDRYDVSSSGSDIGLTTDTPEHAEALRKEREEPEPEQDPEDEVSRLKKIIGDQGNQIGELRRSVSESEVLRKRVELMEQSRATNQQQQGQQQQQALDIYADLPQDQRYMSPLEAQRNNMLAAALVQEAQERQKLQEAVDALTYATTRNASGISEDEERQLLSRKPYLNSLSGAERAAAISDLVQAERSANDAPSHAAAEAARESARKASFVESGSGAPAPDAAQSNATEKLLREARSGRLNSTQMEARMRKLGIGRYDHYNRGY